MTGVFAKYSIKSDDTIEIGVLGDEIDMEHDAIHICLLVSDYHTLFDNLRQVVMENEVLVKAPNIFSNTKKDIRSMLKEAYYRTYPDTRQPVIEPVSIDEDEDEGIADCPREAPEAGTVSTSTLIRLELNTRAIDWNTIAEHQPPSRSAIYRMRRSDVEHTLRTYRDILGLSMDDAMLTTGVLPELKDRLRAMLSY